MRVTKSFCFLLLFIPTILFCQNKKSARKTAKCSEIVKPFEGWFCGLSAGSYYNALLRATNCLIKKKEHKKALEVIQDKIGEVNEHTDMKGWIPQLVRLLELNYGADSLRQEFYEAELKVYTDRKVSIDNSIDDDFWLIYQIHDFVESSVELFGKYYTVRYTITDLEKDLKFVEKYQDSTLTDAEVKTHYEAEWKKSLLYQEIEKRIKN